MLLSETWWPWCPPPLIWNHAKTWRGRGTHRRKKYWWTAGVSAPWFNATADKKITYRNLKNIPLSACKPFSGLQIIANKIKEMLVSRRIISLSCCGDWCRSRDVRQSHSPFNLMPLKAGGQGDSWCWWLFMCYLLLVGGWMLVVGRCTCRVSNEGTYHTHWYWCVEFIGARDIWKLFTYAMN